ncbi:MAG TPA: hypothetical protein VM694_28860 [Polyangium sp.]|nr:hypothetical protein [Polyangium sp.]
MQLPKQGTVRDITVSPDGSVVAAGRQSFSTFGATLTRLAPLGVPDTTYGGPGGVGTLQSGATRDIAISVKLGADGKIVSAGGTNAFTDLPSAMITRHLPDGAPDAGFGAGGVVVLDTLAKAVDVVLQPDGNINNFEVGIVRFDDKGVRDMTFGDNGFVRQNVASVITSDPPAVVPLPDGSFYLATTQVLDRETMVVFKYLPNGKPDLSFGNAGRALVAAPGPWGAYDGLLQPDGKIVLAGRGFSPKSGTDFGLVRITP